MIRQAQLKDFEDIKRIKHELAYDISKMGDLQYRVQIQKTGFLTPGEYTYEEHENDLTKIFLAYENDGHVIGYLRIDDTQEMKRDDNAIWFHPELKEIYFSLPHADIGGVAVSPDIEIHGVATEMLKEAEEKLKEKNVTHLFAFAILSPITNFPSMMFHEKNGFERVAVASAKEMFGLKDFQSILYGKTL